MVNDTDDKKDHFENKDWGNGYDFAFKEFTWWFRKIVEDPKASKVGRMNPDIEFVRDWIVDHKDK